MRLDIGLIGATAIAERAVVRPGSRRDDVSVVAVAASDPDRAAGFAERNAVPRVHRDYAALIDDPAVNTVYVSLHNSAHHRWAVRAACAGCHVVVEKPLCLRPAEFAEIADAAQRSGVCVVEAVPTAGHDWLREVGAMVADRRYGRLREVRTGIRFAAPAPGGYRDSVELGGGIFLDCASYWLHALQQTVGLDGATGTGRAEFARPDGVDRSFVAVVTSADGVPAVLRCEFGDGHRADHEFVFEDATVRLRNFLRPTVGALPLNLVIRRGDGSRSVRSFPATSYYECQLDRLCTMMTTGQGGAGMELPAAGQRVALMAAIHRSAKEKQ